MARAIISHLFETTPIHKITADCHIENTNSEKILIKLGMKKEGISRKARYKQNEWKDELNYGLLREEWNE
jgi:[ribosomal protein S5]-alanine N-acetyltransferase